MLKKEKDARAFVFFTPYRPWLLEKDLAFFDLARGKGFVVERMFEKVMEKVMFEEDPGVSFAFLFSARERRFSSHRHHDASLAIGSSI